MPMHLELLVNNDLRVLAATRAYAREALRQTSMASPEIEKLVELIERSVRAAIEHAYPSGEDGSIKVGITDSRGKLVVTVRDYGMPQDIETLERQVHEPDHPNPRLFGISCQGIADEVHWLGYGPEGKALQIVKWLHNTHITAQVPEDALATFRDDASLAPEQQYTIRRIAADEAVQVSQLIYRAYGGTYLNRDVYYPERVAAENEREIVLSFAAQGEDGRLVGHYALERSQEGPVAEGGQAVVDPAHRGRGLLTRMKEKAVEAARHLGLVGLYSDAVTVHTLTQKSDVDHSAHLTCVDLGIAPRSMHFRRISEEQPQRVTCLLYFLWLQAPQPRTVHVPSRHRAVAEAIYTNLQCPVTFGEGGAPEGHGALTVTIDAGAARASVRADVLGKDSVMAVRHAKRELIEHSHAEVIFVELPLQDPGTPQVALDLECDGFFFAGVAPHFSSRGDLLRLVYLTEPLAREPIKVYEEFAGWLLHYALSEQARVRESLG